MVLDIILIVMLLIGGITGYRRGFFREAASFFGLVIGIFLAIIAADVTGRVLVGMVDWNPLPYKIAAFVIVFMLVVLILWAVGASLTKLFKVIMLNFFNRLAGLAFGVLKTAMLLSVLFYLVLLLNEHWSLFSEQSLGGSKVYSLIDGLAPWLFKGLTFL